MKAYTVDLKEHYNLQGGSLECVLMEMPWDVPQEWKRPALIVVPGGAYSMVSKREGAPIATEFLTRGFQTFILTYLCAPDGARYPEQLTELACAVDYVKKNAEKFNVNPNEVFVVGFSAGGHLTANLAVEHFTVSEKTGMDLDCTPTAVGLAYPVITNKEAYKGTHDNLLNGYTPEAKEELLKTLNLDEAVTEYTAPSFIWTTATDPLVPAANSMLFALALARKNVAYELHVYPQGSHGLSTGALEINTPQAGLDRIGAWVNDCVSFFRLFIKEKL